MSVNSLSANIFSWFSLCMNSVIPFTILLAINCSIIFEMKRHSRFMANRSDSKVRQGVPNETNKRDKQVTVMLLLVTFVMLFLNIPLYCRIVIFRIVDPMTSPIIYAWFSLAYHVTNKLIWTNSAINFYLYCFSGSKFRNEFFSIICFRRRRYEGNSSFPPSVIRRTASSM